MSPLNGGTWLSEFRTEVEKLVDSLQRIKALNHQFTAQGGTPFVEDYLDGLDSPKLTIEEVSNAIYSANLIETEAADGFNYANLYTIIR